MQSSVCFQSSPTHGQRTVVIHVPLERLVFMSALPDRSSSKTNYNFIQEKEETSVQIQRRRGKVVSLVPENVSRVEEFPLVVVIVTHELLPAEDGKLFLLPQ